MCPRGIPARALLHPAASDWTRRQATLAPDSPLQNAAIPPNHAYGWIALGGALGALGRFGVAGWVTTWAHGGFPWGTFAANVGGSLALGLLVAGVRAVETHPAARGFLVTGLCGGFTTFSAFDFEVLSLIRDGRVVLAGAYAASSVLVCVAAVMLGRRAGAVRRPRRSAPSPRH